MTKKANILFFFTDDQRFDTIAALGNDQIKTPNMDKLVAKGVTFTHAHIPSGTNGAVCMPSRAMLHTGRTLYHLKNAGLSIPTDHITIGETLQKHGYHTFGTGKWHNGKSSYARSFTDGDEIFFGGMDDHWNVAAYHFDPTGKYEKTINRCIDPFYSQKLKTVHCDHIKAGKHSSELFCDAAINFLEDYNSEQPFFLYISFMAPHDPRTMPEKFHKMYDPENIKLPPNFMTKHPFDTGDLKVRDEMLADFPRNPSEIKEHIAEYYAMITHLDDEMGKVLSKLEEEGYADDTIIVFAGDNGLALGQHGLMGKQSCYEHSNRVPLIFAGPGIPKNIQSDAYCYLLDIYPTLCELTDIDSPKSVEGISLVKAMNDSNEKVRNTIFIGYEKYQRSIKDRQYKLIEYNVNGQRNRQLFDLINDPWEKDNLAKNTQFTAKQEELHKKLLQWCKEWDDFESPWGKEFWGKS